MILGDHSEPHSKPIVTTPPIQHAAPLANPVGRSDASVAQRLDASPVRAPVAPAVSQTTTQTNQPLFQATSQTLPQPSAIPAQQPDPSFSQPAVAPHAQPDNRGEPTVEYRESARVIDGYIVDVQEKWLVWPGGSKELVSVVREQNHPLSSGDEDMLRELDIFQTTNVSSEISEEVIWPFPTVDDSTSFPALDTVSSTSQNESQEQVVVQHAPEQLSVQIFPDAFPPRPLHEEQRVVEQHDIEVDPQEVDTGEHLSQDGTISAIQENVMMETVSVQSDAPCDPEDSPRVDKGKRRMTEQEYQTAYPTSCVQDIPKPDELPPGCESWEEYAYNIARWQPLQDMQPVVQ